MYCKNCGNPIAVGENVCANCGEQVEGMGKRVVRKKPLQMPTVWIALVLSLAAIVAIFLPWVSASAMGVTQSMTFRQLTSEEETLFMTPLAVIANLWVILFFLTNHPKLTLIGTLANAFSILIIMMAISQFNGMLQYGAGFYLYIAATIICFVCAFATKKQKKAKKRKNRRD